MAFFAIYRHFCAFGRDISFFHFLFAIKSGYVPQN